jgi:hydrogenase nickel incorporation protein HypA/HybF
MHEVHLVQEIVDKVQQQARAEGAQRVKRVKIRFNRLTSHSGEHVRFVFDVAKKESTMIKDAALDLVEVAPIVRCRRCGFEYEGNQLPEVCPECFSMDVDPLNPTEMVLEGFET